MMKESTGIQELLQKHPRARAVLERAGIDPEEKTTLILAASKYGISLKPLLAALDEIVHILAEEDKAICEVSESSSQDLIGYVEKHHHTFLRRELPRLEKLLHKVMQAHHRDHGSMLGSLQAVFASFKTEIEEHLRIEEQILFPRISDVERNLQDNSSSEGNWSSVDVSALEQMKHEHALVDMTLREIRGLTSNFSLPKDASRSLTALYEGFARLETRLHEHIALENDFLWPIKPRRLATGESLCAETVVDPVAKAVDICPLTDKPCEAGSHTECSRFWDCVAQAIGKKSTG